MKQTQKPTTNKTQKNTNKQLQQKPKNKKTQNTNIKYEKDCQDYGVFF